jgi:hypothetical protein
MQRAFIKYQLLFLLAVLPAIQAYAQPQVSAKLDAAKITIGDQARLFIEAKPAANEKLIWAVYPDTFNNLEIVEKGKIDTLNQDGIITYKQRLLITGWDSGMFRIPAFTFTSVPASGAAYNIITDSFQLEVQTLAVDTAKPFRPIVDILPVAATWMDYIWYIIGGIIAIVLIIYLIWYFKKNKNIPKPVMLPQQPVEALTDRTLRLLDELDKKQLWQTDKVKDYYTELTDILRNYIEERFNTPAMELTSDELLMVVRKHREMTRQYDSLSVILRTADMAKFAKAQPLPQEHVTAFEYTKTFVIVTKPVVAQNEQKS